MLSIYLHLDFVVEHDVYFSICIGICQVEWISREMKPNEIIRVCV